MELKFKKLLDHAILPTRATEGDAGLDLYAAESAFLYTGRISVVQTGVAVEIPHGYVGLVHPRSGLAAKHGITVVNAPGTIDAGYRGEVKIIMTMLQANVWGDGGLGMDRFIVSRGDRVAQLVIQKVELPTPVWADELSDSVRGEGGLGSTGYGIIEGSNDRSVTFN